MSLIRLCYQWVCAKLGYRRVRCIYFWKDVQIGWLSFRKARLESKNIFLDTRRKAEAKFPLQQVTKSKYENQ